MHPPIHPIAAVTHPDPYPYYAALRRERPFDYHESLGFWVAASAEAVTEALRCDALLVRPSAEPVPRALQGSPAGALFAQLIRMRDDPDRIELRRQLATMLDRADERQIEALAVSQVRAVLAATAPLTAAERLDAVAVSVPVRTVAALIGIAGEDLERAQRLTQAFAGALAENASADTLARGSLAALDLQQLVSDGAATASPALVANLCGLLIQSSEATAGLIGNALVAWARRPRAEPATSLDVLIAQVLRSDPVTHNTRRFVARDCTIAGRHLRAGERVLVVLAAADCMIQFGHGPHACPGARHATAITRAALRELLSLGLESSAVLGSLGYRPYPNLRIPRFA